MKNELKIDENLFFLEHLLTSLGNFNFNNDITKLLNSLTEEVNKTLWSKLKNGDIENYEIVFRYKLEKN